MRAIAIEGFGGPEVMHVTNVPSPQPSDGEVAIRMAYAGVNPADWKLREGWLNRFEWFRPSFPFVLGYDGAGIVEAVGDGVSGFREGDRVLAKSDQSFGRWGTFAERLCVAAEMVGLVPDAMKLEEAATLPVAGLTAWHGLFQHGGLKAGQTVFINAGAGGVGSLAVQFAAQAGARVLASCSPGNAAYLESLGAERTFDYTAPDLAAAVTADAGQVDLLLDAAGAPNRELLSILKRGGTYVRVPSLGPDDAIGSDAYAHARGLKLVSGGIIRKEARSALEAMAALFNDGRLKPPEIEILPIVEAEDALERSKAGKQRGKVVLKIWE
jgi:NADPH2:quinone reductase